MTSASTDRYVEALSWLQRLAEGQKSKPSKPPLSITISRQAGSGGAEVARAVGARLGWPVYDNELLQRISQEKGLQARLLEQLDERHMGWLEEMVASFCVTGAGKEVGYLRSLIELLVSLSEEGHCVIVGRGGAQVLPAETTLRVRIVAPRDHRIDAVEKRRGISRAEAEHWIDRTDKERKHFVQHYFQKDPDDPMGADLMLNTGKLSVDACVNMLVDAVKALETKVSI
ncbi:MAG: AAA family ATPase [Thermomicrobiales bacterium]